MEPLKMQTLLQMNISDDEMQKAQSQSEINPNRMIGMCYVPMQVWETPYDSTTAYHVGTIFPSLNKPFTGGGR